MKPTLNDDDIAHLGLGAITIGEAEPLPMPQEVVSKGSTVSGEVSFQDVVDGRVETGFLDLGVQTASHAGFTVKFAGRNSRILMIRSDSRAFNVRGQDPDTSWIEDPTTILLDVGRMEKPVALLYDDDTGFVFKPSIGGHYLWPLLGHPIDVPPLADISSDIALWLTDENDDWLVRQCRAHLGQESPYHHVAAVGMLARLKLPDDVGDSVRRILAGDYDPMIDRERAWFRALTPHQVETVEMMSVSEVVLLEEHLEMLFDLVNSADIGWRRAVVESLHRRDDLEGVRVLLSAALKENALQSACMTLDRYGLQFVISIPPIPEATRSVRLQRAACVNPEAWWVRPIVVEQ